MLVACHASCDSAAASTSDPPHLRVFPAHPASQSPSLGRGKTPAYELKFVLDEAQAAAVEARLSTMLTLDPHADPANGNSYALTTLYCDTPQWHVYERAGRFRLFKFRLRRYGESPSIYLERKSKLRRQVRKHRTPISLAELDRFHLAPSDDWSGAWYQRQLVRNQLRPACLIRYQRVAYFGHGSEGPLRLTFDRSITGCAAQGWSLESGEPRQVLLTDRVICEFKYKGVLPALFKLVMQELSLTPGGFSKYRAGVSAMHAARN